MKVLVLYGGDSPEREVSLRSGTAVNQALINAGVETILYDPINGDEELFRLVAETDMVFPILHGKNCEDGVIQKKLESVGAIFLGTGSVASDICFNKEKTHHILEGAGILMPAFAVVSSDDLDNPLFSKPFVLKPTEGGSSVDTLVVREVTDSSLQSARDLLKKYDSMLLEQLIVGIEITVPVFDALALPVIAIVPPENGEFDYENKYNGATQELCPAPEELVSQEKQKNAQALALKVHELLGARHLSRTDIIVDADGNMYVLELNTMPGMTNQSLFPVSAKVAGYTMEQFVLKLVEIVGRDA
jgi:D-alanine-D-alanine ligase